MPAYLGQEGYCREFELRKGKQHCQKDTPALLARVLNTAREITDRPLLLRFDGGNDSIENIDVVLELNEQNPKPPPVDFGSVFGEPHSPKRHKAKRRRIKTVMQELMVVAARVIKTAGSLKLAFGRGCRSLPAFEYVYRKLSIQLNKPLV